MKIIKFPDPRLKRRSEEVKDFGADLQTLAIATTCTLMATPSGIGLSAIQVGVPLRMLVYKTDTGTFNILVNPEIVATKGKPTADYEGCLSIPGYLVEMFRHNRIQVKFTDQYGNKVETKWFIGDVARLVQHEIDHMDGKLISDPHPVEQDNRIEPQNGCTVTRNSGHGQSSCGFQGFANIYSR